MENEKKVYTPLPVLGAIKEKGFSDDEPLLACPESQRAFPVARHRSNDPHWEAANNENIYGEDGIEQLDVHSSAALAQPLHRKKRKELQFSDLKSSSSRPPQTKNAPPTTLNIKEIDETDAELDNCYQGIAAAAAAASSKQKSSPDAKKLPESEEQRIDSENRNRVLTMTQAELAEARNELAERLSPEMLSMLQNRGIEKEKKRKEQKKEAQVSAEPVNESKAFTTETNREGGRSWTERVESIKLIRFDLQGNVLSKGEDTEAQEVVAVAVSVAERDYLRSEGDPAARGYTLKEAAMLTRSTVPGQRVVALRIISNVLSNAANGLMSDKTVTDWQAVWAYAVGPHPELVLNLRISLDDSHVTALAACANALQALLTYPQNEYFFTTCEAFWPGNTQIFFTAPIFRKQVKQEEGFLGGGHWKYNVKTSELFPKDDEANNTIGDDANVASQDVAAGLIRMGILPRIRYILEVDNIRSAEEPLLNVLIALARHSPAVADSVMKCPRLLNTIIQEFLLADDNLNTQSRSSRVKAIQLVKVLCQVCKANCISFANLGVLQVAKSDLFKWSFRFTEKLNEAREEVYRPLYLEALGLWRICVNYGIGINLISDFYPALCSWLTPPSSDALLQLNDETFEMAHHSYNALQLLATKLPTTLEGGEDKWSWSIALPIVNTSVGWLVANSRDMIVKELKERKKEQHYRCGYMGVLGSVLHFVSTVCERMSHLSSKQLSQAQFTSLVEAIGVCLVKSKLLDEGDENWTVLAYDNGEDDGKTCPEFMLSHTSCVHGVVRLASAVDELVKLQEEGIKEGIKEGFKSGLVLAAEKQLKELMVVMGRMVERNGDVVHACEVKGRGGPSPGVGLGWGCVDGGWWTPKILLVQAQTALALDLALILPQQQLNRFHLGVGIVSTATHHMLIRKAFAELLFTSDYLSLLASISQRKVLTWKEQRKNLTQSSSAAVSSTATASVAGRMDLVKHFCNTWLPTKKRHATVEGKDDVKDEGEGGGENEGGVMREWRGRRVPLEYHWLLSAVLPSEDMKVIRRGLSVILGIEEEEGEESGLGLTWKRVSVCRKIHALSNIFAEGEMFLEEDINQMLGALQDMYGVQVMKGGNVDYEGEIDSNYGAVGENVAEQFVSVSYGNVMFGRQVSFYLVREVSSEVRYKVWCVLSQAKVLDLLPEMKDCPVTQPAHYLNPPEENEKMIEAYVEAWRSGGLDRAERRNSVSFALAIHHIVGFIFKKGDDLLLVRKKFGRTLVRSSSSSYRLKEMMVKMVHYDVNGDDEVKQRIEFLVASCEGNTTLITHCCQLSL